MLPWLIEKKAILLDSMSTLKVVSTRPHQKISFKPGPRDVPFFVGVFAFPTKCDSLAELLKEKGEWT
jgi:hypothetical protein